MNADIYTHTSLQVGSYLIFTNQNIHSKLISTTTLYMFPLITSCSITKLLNNAPINEASLSKLKAIKR